MTDTASKLPYQKIERMNLRELLVVVPHSGIVIPSEIDIDSLSDSFPDLLRNVDWYTNWLYDFRDMLNNQQIVFPYCSLLLEANRDPVMLDDSVPLKDIHGQPIYRTGQEPGWEQRKHLSDKYLLSFHSTIETAIISGAEFILDGHSTVTARGVSENQIELMNFQQVNSEKEPDYFCPDVFVTIYAEELRKRLPEIKVSVNESEYYRVYGHICAQHSVNAFSRVGKRVPALIQETNESLYKNADRTVNVMALNRLRHAFAHAIYSTMNRVRNLKQGNYLIDLHSLRQTYDYDCGTKALQTVMAYYGVGVREDKLLKELDSGPEGTAVEDMVRVARARGFEVRYGENWTLDDLKEYVKEGHPIIVLIQAWADKVMSLKDWRTSFDHGHYAIVIGFNKQVVFFEDPSSFHRTWLKDSEFLARWHDMDATNRILNRFGMVLLGRNPVGKLIEHMD
ncbi:N-formylglutamate amidohydrolase [bacterium]|nr:N-formylglutamate amidohydrolase [bacterium]